MLTVAAAASGDLRSGVRVENRRDRREADQGQQKRCKRATHPEEL
jgi:hypothetical protein